MDTCIRKVFEDHRNRYFWESFEACIQLTYLPVFLQYPAGSKVHEHLLSVSTGNELIGFGMTAFDILVCHVVLIMKLTCHFSLPTSCLSWVRKSKAMSTFLPKLYWHG